MSDAAGALDLRLPIGGLFTTLGVIIGGYGLATAGDTQRYAPSSGMNINLIWGIVMLVFGLLMLLAARRGRPTLEPTGRSPEGMATEIREHSEGMER